MELKLSFLFVGFSLIFSSCFFQESAGFGLPSLSTASSLLLSIKSKTPDYSLFRGTQPHTFPENDIAVSPTSTHTRSGTTDPFEAFHARSPSYHSSTEAPNPHKFKDTRKIHATYAPSPSHIRHHFGKIHRIAPEPYHSSPHRKRGHVITTSPSPSPPFKTWNPRKHLPFPAIPYKKLNAPSPSPAIKKPPMALPGLKFPSPPPNQACKSITCDPPLVHNLGAACSCAWPIEVRLRLSISAYAFFPLVEEFSKEIADSIPLDRRQVVISGASEVDLQLENINVDMHLVPQDVKFKSTAAFSIYMKFWRREISVNSSLFGPYEVVYVRYPGLPPSPPSVSSDSATIDVQPYPGSRNDDGPIKPLGVDVPRRTKNESSKNMVVVIVLSSVTAFVVLMGCIFMLLSKSGCFRRPHDQNPQGFAYSEEKAPAGGSRLMTFRSRPSSASMSFNSSLLACTGTSKVFSIEDMERATDKFNPSRILGEGGFGLVYGGVLDDGRKVAVKVLKRDDHQGSREFLAEVEMLSRLHHRNLVTLIGICPEDHCRCLVYELVPNGSVESHLHGTDKEVAPLDWSARMKIALGAARGLAYLHEDSSPRVIHRDFKSSNILLENDFTPKVSDFGLARTAMEEGNKHVSTHVMGTFGYLAPEYALTGHLLVKSDVYSYGVVLLELLTGRKPVDLTQPPGQENLVAWARPLLATREGLEIIIDPTIKPNVPLDNMAKVAAIAAMCVQPEVSHRPFMGEVVQALKLVCNDFEETREPVSRNYSQEDISIEIESKGSRLSDELMEVIERYDSSFHPKIGLSAVDLKGASAAYEGQESESFRRQFNSVPLKMGRKRKFWQRLRGLSRGSLSDHEYSSYL